MRAPRAVFPVNLERRAAVEIVQIVVAPDLQEVPEVGVSI